MSHLERAMRAKKIRVFVDTMLQVTQDIDELLQILERTAVSVVIFSGKFADSSWCLDEVYTIAQSVEKLGHRAIPVFYDVDSATVAGDYHWFHDLKAVFLSCFRTCFLPTATPYAKTIAGLDAIQEKKDEWMKSLKVVASNTECTSESFPNEAKLVEEVVAKATMTLASMSSGIEFNKLVGMNSRVFDVEQMLAMDEHSSTIRIVGLWGMGGLGKSTLARTCYERLKRVNAKEMRFHFIDKINETYDKPYLIEGLVQELYSTLLSESRLTRGDVNVGYRRARLRRSKVFVVLDDVQTPSQLEQLLLGEALSLVKLFASGSRIIITTRDKMVLEYVKAEMYPVENLNDDESLQLFKMNAFQPVDHFISHDWNSLSHKVTSYCKGNPLALKVLAGTLLYKDKAYWESFLRKLSEIQEPEIHHVLRRSYGELEKDDKRLFLDIACFFYGTLKSLLIKYMETSYTSSYSRVQDLIDKSLLISNTDNVQGEAVVVHGLLREMAWNIVTEEENIKNRTRFKDSDDVHNLLTIPEVKDTAGIRETQGIQLDLSKAGDMNLKPNAFRGMESLRWLGFAWPKCVGYGNLKIKFLDGELSYLPNELRGLYWDQFPSSSSLPSGFSPQKLAYLILNGSPIHKCWERDQQPKLEHLLLLSLSDCRNLTTVPNLTSSCNLEHILLRGCKTLTDIPATIQSLERLVRLDARDCQNLVNVPSSIESKFLMQLLLSNCPNLTRCPEVDSPEFQALDLDGTPINSLPSSTIYNVKQNGMVSLYGPNVTHFPHFSNRLELIRLRKTAISSIEFDGDGESKSDRMHLIQNAQLETLPTSIWNMISVELIVQDCPLIGCLPVISEPYSRSLTKLRIAGCKSITEFPSSICKLRFLEVLVFVSTGIECLPWCIGEMEQLSYLDLSYNAILKSVPSTINQLAKLTEFLLIGCDSIESLPEMLPPNLNVLKANNCGSLQALSRNVGNLSFQHLRLDDCPKLDRNLLDEIVVNFPDQALSRHSHVGFHYSGSEVPEWFGERSIDDEDHVTMELPIDYSAGKLKGVAFGVVYSLDQQCGSMHIVGGCFVGNEVVWRWTSLPWEYHVLDNSDRVFLWSDNTFYDFDDEEQAWHNKYAGRRVSFRFFTVVKFGDVVTPCIVKKCGVSLLY
ncbi:Disease resistance-like protein DSC1 [Linum perenne]